MVNYNYRSIRLRGSCFSVKMEIRCILLLNLKRWSILVTVAQHSKALKINERVFFKKGMRAYALHVDGGEKRERRRERDDFEDVIDRKRGDRRDNKRDDEG